MLRHKVCVFERDSLVGNSIKFNDASVEVFKELCTGKKCRRPCTNVIVVIDMKSYGTVAVTTFLVNKPDLYVIIVNAKENLKYQLYECGAADVMVGALDKMELRYKIKNRIKFLKRMNSEYMLGDVSYDVQNRMLKKDNKTVVLPALQNKIFTLLVKDYYDDKLLPKEEIFNTMVDESSRIQNHMARLRYSLSYIGSEKVSIETIYGRGYKLNISNK